MWGSEPVSIANKDESNAGKKPGVYWETQKPLPDGSGTLPAGMIRLIGRYWEQDVVYKVNLTAAYNGKSVKRLIKVVKPVRLYDKNEVKGDDNFKPGTEYKTTNDIRDEQLDIDALCIEYANAIGMPPQIIKSQIFQESDKTGFRFNPSYRYEPFFDMSRSNPNSQYYLEDYLTQPFVVTESSMGEGEAIPTDHQNVKPSSYPLTQIKIGDFITRYWNRYWNSSDLKVIGSKDLTKLWQILYVSYLEIATFENPYILATEYVKSYVKQNYTYYAQTRKAASYGILQMLYTTAQERGYNAGKTVATSSAPEKLNDQIIEMPLYKSFIEQKMKKVFRKATLSDIPLSEWSEGWEKKWTDILKRYNTEEKYAPSVMLNSKKFYPKSK